MKKLIKFIGTGGILLGSFSTPLLSGPTLQLLHASDLEGGVDALERAPTFTAITEAARDGVEQSILLSAGDNYIPGPFFNAAGSFALGSALQDTYEILLQGSVTGELGQIEVREGAVDITIMNINKFDASAVGNHEFDAGSESFRDLMEEEWDNDAVSPDKNQIDAGEIEWPGANFPYLSANLDFSGDEALTGLATGDILPNTAFQYTLADLVSPDISVDPVKFPVSQEDSLKLAPAVTIERGAETYGVIGATTQILNTITSASGTTVIGPDEDDMVALAAIIQPVIDELETSGVNKIILITHLQQIALEKELAGLLDGIDVIVAGGSDTLQANDPATLNPGDAVEEPYPFVTTDLFGSTVLIVSTDGEYSYVGRLLVEFDDFGEVISWSGDPIATQASNEAVALDSIGFNSYADLRASTETDDTVQNLVDALTAIIQAKDGEVFGETTTFLEGRRDFVRTEETNLGNLTADANLAAAQAWVDANDPFGMPVEVSIKNGGGIRNLIGEIVNNIETGETELLPPQANTDTGKLDGQISRLDIENTLRFNNGLTLVTLSAADLFEIIEHGVSNSIPGNTPGQFPQVAGLNFSFDFEGTPKVRSLSLKDKFGYTTDVIVEDGVVVGDPERPIRVVTLDFLASDFGGGRGGDDYPFVLLGEDLIDTGIGEQGAFIDYLVANHGIGAGTPFSSEEFGLGIDDRIQNLTYRSDTANYPTIVDPTTPALSFLGTYQGLVFDEGAAEIVAYDANTQKLFSVNADAGTVDILDLSDPANPAKIDSIDLGADFAESDVEIGPNSVAVHDGMVAVAVERVYVNPVTEDEDQLPGRIAIYNTDGVLLEAVETGFLPDMVIFSPDGSKILTANEGEQGDTTDPEGSVTIYDLAKGKVKQVSFAKFNGDREELAAAGVRFLSETATVAQDLEPEYIAIDPVTELAYVACQEANCFVVVDLKGGSAQEVIPLGFKDWSSIATGFDASDRDDAINLQPWPAIGMYQPDAIDYFQVGDRRFIITAGEGDARDADDFDGDKERLKDYDLEPGLFPEWIAEDDAMGRLEISRLNADMNNNGLIDTIWTFGSRSFSLFEITKSRGSSEDKGNGKKKGHTKNSKGKQTVSLAYDSGSDLELITAALLPTAFNSNNDENDSFDSRSDAKGPEPEAVDVGVVDGRTYAFIGLERIGGVMVYEVSNPDAPQFVQYYNNRDFSVDVEDDLAAAGDLGPECVLFIPAEESPNGENLLLVSNEVSGSLTIFEFKN